MNAIVTIIGNQKIEELSRPFFQKYAKKIGSCHVVLDDKKDIENVFNYFDRIIYLENNILIRDDCPNLFNLVPENYIGALNLGLYPEKNPGEPAFIRGV